MPNNFFTKGIYYNRVKSEIKLLTNTIRINNLEKHETYSLAFDKIVAANKTDICGIQTRIKRNYKTDSNQDKSIFIYYTVIRPKYEHDFNIAVDQFKFYSTDDQELWYKEIHRKLSSPENMRPKSLIVFINPICGYKKGVKLFNTKANPIFQLAEIKTKITITEQKNEALAKILHKNEKLADGIVVVGGDGTFMEVIHGVMLKERRARGFIDSDHHINSPEFQTPIRIGILPAGCTNSVIQSTNGTMDIMTNALCIALGFNFSIDTMGVYKSNKFLKYNVSLMGFGYFGNTIVDSESHRWMGPKRYDLYGFKNWINLKSFNAEIKILKAQTSAGIPYDGKICYRNCLHCIQPSNESNNNWVTTTGKFVAFNSFLISCRCEKAPKGPAPFSHLNNGYTDIYLVKDCSRFQYLKYLMRLSSKMPNPNYLDFIEVYRTNQFSFKLLSDNIEIVQNDNIPLEISNVHVINVLLPRKELTDTAVCQEQKESVVLLDEKLVPSKNNGPMSINYPVKSNNNNTNNNVKTSSKNIRTSVFPDSKTNELKKSTVIKQPKDQARRQDRFSEQPNKIQNQSASPSPSRLKNLLVHNKSIIKEDSQEHNIPGSANKKLSIFKPLPVEKPEPVIIEVDIKKENIQNRVDYLFSPEKKASVARSMRENNEKNKETKPDKKSNLNEMIVSLSAARNQRESMIDTKCHSQECLQQTNINPTQNVSFSPCSSSPINPQNTNLKSNYKGISYLHDCIDKIIDGENTKPKKNRSTVHQFDSHEYFPLIEGKGSPLPDEFKTSHSVDSSKNFEPKKTSFFSSCIHKKATQNKSPKTENLSDNFERRTGTNEKLDVEQLTNSSISSPIIETVKDPTKKNDKSKFNQTDSPGTSKFHQNLKANSSALSNVMSSYNQSINQEIKELNSITNEINIDINGDNAFWNCDGEIVYGPAIQCKVHRNMIRIFARGIEEPPQTEVKKVSIIQKKPDKKQKSKTR